MLWQTLYWLCWGQLQDRRVVLEPPGETLREVLVPSNKNGHQIKTKQAASDLQPP